MERQIKLEGCLNFRDLGGYPTGDGRHIRWRRLFRSDALHLLTSADVACMRDELGVTDVVDLRSTAELRSEGRGPLADQPMRFHHLPLYDGRVTNDTREQAQTVSLADRYYYLAEMAKDPIARVVRTLAGAEGAAVYHCAAGKDRTGVISAVLLGLLGVRDEIIVADYAATKENLDAIVDRLMALEGYQTMLSALPPDTMHAEPETMVAFLGRLRTQYGSMHDYARAAGVETHVLEQLGDRLIA